MFTEQGMCPLMPSKAPNLKLIEGGLRELEIILHGFESYDRSMGYPSCTPKAVIYSINGNRGIYDLLVEDDLTRTQTEESRLAAEKLVNSIGLLESRNSWKRNKHLKHIKSETVDTYPSIREGFCTIHDIFSEPEKQSEPIQQSGKIDLDQGLSIDILLDFKILKTRLKKFYLEHPFIVVLNIKLENPVNCYSDTLGRVYVKTQQLSDENDLDGNKKLIPTVSEFTFDYAVLGGDYDEIDIYQFSHKAAVLGLKLNSYEWVNGDLILGSNPPFRESPELDDTPF